MEERNKKSHPLPYGWLGWVVLSSPDTLCDA